ncbi:MAG: hypothetical protein H6631_00365 [Anaerolineaceae bacterium]|nr:hypothetical protein [Anaerolineaceae bacterium]MCB9100247.1 hypothetical protein [Anaerolineales bacterium]
MSKISWIEGLGFVSTGLFVLLGLLIVWLTGQSTHLSCVRLTPTTANCLLQRQFLGVIPAGQRDIANVSEVELQEDCFDGCTYWVELLAEEERVSLTRFATYSRRRAQFDQQSLAQYLVDHPVTTFQHTSPPEWIGFAAGLFLAVFGSVLLWWFSRRR